MTINLPFNIIGKWNVNALGIHFTLDFALINFKKFNSPLRQFLSFIPSGD